MCVTGGSIALWWWWRLHPTPRPFAEDLWVEAPHPLITRRRLLEILAPMPGERVLEVGPGSGYYALPTAERLGPSGRLDVLDIQQQMLDRTLARARARGLSQLVASQGDATKLPYAAGSFDAAYMISTLGQTADQTAALRELRRVLRPGGRLVVGEVAVDPHGVFLGALRRSAAEAGLQLQARSGNWVGFFARLSPTDS